MTILNLTQHSATADQQEAGVIDLPSDRQEQLRELLTFNELPTGPKVEKRAYMIRQLVDMFDPNHKITKCMLGGAPFLMPRLEEEMRRSGMLVLYAFSVRESVETTTEDGSVVKQNIFRHKGFVEGIY